MIAALLLATACAGGPGPGDSRYEYNVDGRYTGRLMVDGEPFDATLEVRTLPGGRVRGTYSVRAPLEIEGDVDGRVIDDVVRLTLRYEGSGGDASDACPGIVDGVLSVSRGGGVVEGPVTIDDCGSVLPGRMSFRRVPPGR